MGLKIDFLFFCPDIEKNKALSSEESFHAVKVLRKKQGDLVHVTDGKGGWFSCKITLPNPKNCEIEIIDAQYEYQKAKREIYIAIAPTKSSDRIEYFLEKGTEIGITGIFLLKTQHSYPKKINKQRLEKIVISAMKQSLKAYKPFVSELLEFKTFIGESKSFEQRFIAHLANGSKDINEVEISNKMLVLIGPEGDFSEEELNLAHQNNFMNITLGNSRLRTETAGVYTVSVLNSRS